MPYLVNNYLSENAVVMGREDFIRPMTFGNNWSKIRVAVRYSIFRTYGNIYVPQFGLGVCNGATGGYNSVTSDWVGCVFGGNPKGLNSPFTRYSTNYNVYYGPSGIGDPCRKLGVSYTNIASAYPSTSNFYAGTDGQTAFYLLIDINRTANWTTAVFGSGLPYAYEANVQVNINRYTYMTAIENETGTPTQYAGFWGVGTIAIGGVYDHVCITWGKSTPSVILFDVTVLRFN